MKESIQLDHPLNPACELDSAEHGYNQSIVIPAQLIAPGDGFERKEQSWSLTSQIPTDTSIQVQDVTFYVHKFPLVSKCGYFGRTEHQPPNSELGYDIKLDNFPGGSETFELILKFCYDLPVGLNPNNVAALRCASEFLEMTEAQEDGNLITKTEAFFTFVVLSSWKDTITVLRSCETLSPWAENLQIVRRCCDSIAWKASREDSSGEINNHNSWWFEDLVTLRIDHFTRITTAIKAKGVKPETLGSCIMQYGEKWLPIMETETRQGRYTYGRTDVQWNVVSGRRQDGSSGPNKEQKALIESLISILPPQKESVPCKFLLRLLKMAMRYSASPALIAELEKRVGMVLEYANMHDLLIPTYTLSDQGKPLNMIEEQTMHNIDVVQRILEYYLMYEQQKHQQEQKSAAVNIFKLVDSYLAEIAGDPNLSVTKFQVLAELLPRNARKCDDGLYRAIDTYLKTHPSLSEHDRRKLCKIMNCEKLSVDARKHAAQNDRLPLRTILQVLFSEQEKIRAAMQGHDNMESGNDSEQENCWSSTKQEVKLLKAELEKIKMTMAELQKDYSELQDEYEKVNNKQRNLSRWLSGWRKIKRSSIFQRKVDGEETDDAQSGLDKGCRVSFRRRQSIS